MTIVLFVAGLVFLIFGAEFLVRGASRLAAAVGISPLVVGLTVVAFGTSAPELAVSVKSALSDQAGIAVGNVVGSNIFNVLFILGVSALIVPLVVSSQLIRLDVPIMLALSVLVLLLALDGDFNRVDGISLFTGLLIYIGALIYMSRKETAAVKKEFAQEYASIPTTKPNFIKDVLLIIVGLALLVTGSRWFVDSAVTFAQYLGVSDVIVGLTIVAAGTSMPEVVTSIIAALRGERDIAVGNVVGSNIFNIMGVLGVASIIAPSGIAISPEFVRFDIPVMILVALACVPIFFTGGVISRQEGFVLLAYYVAYTAYLIMISTNSAALSWFGPLVLFVAIPLTFITMLVLAVREARRRKNGNT
ncbi:calcium/sodium antiporter [Pseudohongiella sp.]|uniref:Sodium/calcium exchanger membrane region domain-containing protein n=1 Tax=marine sediment metagenome TaxID=412755 RepID=A0A0F9Z5P6_9ZZZZ|nr:calcium/sodium antiporter [Pseudohongiella sp.]HDZ07720.1 calcium/sodium antiporter [Pseudohongiella sp.]HEA63300.1 calcium/sodium antiporter [Pseudohongiella sp.]